MIPLQQLLKRLTTEPREIWGDDSVSINAIEFDSRKIGPGAMFAALRGAMADGHDYIDQCVAAGATAILCETRPKTPHPAATFVVVNDSRAALAEVAAAFYRSPSSKLRLAGVTGTNGKTTTTYLLKGLCDHAFMRAGLIGTVQYELGDETVPASRTTPESTDLNRMLDRMLDNGCKAAVMEVSSHALVQHRSRGIEFDVVVFTNLSQDHLDYHRNMDEYFEAKATLFDVAAEQRTKTPVAVINIDDGYGQKLAKRIEKKMEVITYGFGSRARFRATSLRSEVHGTQFSLEAEGRQYLVRVPLIGRFNVYNALCALAAARGMGCSLRDSVRALADTSPVPGRMQQVPARRAFAAYVDYAHTPDALEKALQTARELNPRTLICVFGCGGDRDKAKRPLMGAVAAKLADMAIVTSDNPRNEDPSAIIRDIKSGMKGHTYEVVEDRAKAIERAVELAWSRDIILIAGKGHEDYQEIQGERLHFDDVQVASRAIEARKPDHLNRPQ